MLVTTLCIIHQPKRILLGMKKRGLGKGKWNGFGGKIGKDEKIEAAMIREAKEEAGIIVDSHRKAGVARFHFENGQESIEVHIYSASDYVGEPRETEEMMPQWFDVSDIPFKQMWADDVYWMPYFLAGKYFEASFWFKDESTLDHFVIKEG